MDQQILNTILKDTYTISQLKHKIATLRAFLSSKIFGSVDQNFTAEESNWLSTLPPQFIESFNKDNIDQIISNLEAYVSKIQILTLYLPFETNKDALEQIGIRAKSLFNLAFLLDIKFDPNLIAGCALSWKGIYKDYSLRSRIDEQKGEILENLKKYLR